MWSPTNHHDRMSSVPIKPCDIVILMFIDERKRHLVYRFLSKLVVLLYLVNGLQLSKVN